MTTTAHDATTGPVRPGSPPPFDRELAVALEAIAQFLPPSLTPDLIPQLRNPDAGMPPPSDEDLACDGMFTVETLTAPGPTGAPDISLLVCRPAAVSTPTAAIYHTHGGGMIMGTNRTGMLGMMGLAKELSLAVVSVEYRLAPECPHPAPVEDCYAGLAWTAAHAAELGIDPARVVIGGASAGGGLAAGVALMARDRRGPDLFGQLLLCPMLDDRNDTPSARQMAGLGVWDRTANDTGWRALLGDACGGADVSPYAAPARATDLSGLPPAFVDVGSAETFRDEDIAYAGRMMQAGGQVELHVWPGGFHGFDGFVPTAAVSRDAVAARANWLRRLLAA